MQNINLKLIHLFIMMFILLPACQKAVDKNNFSSISSTENPIYGGKLSVSADKNDGWLDPISSVTYWAKKYNMHPENSKIAVSYSQALRQIGSYQKASEIMTDDFLKNNNPTLQSTLEMVKILTGMGRAAEAIKYAQMAIKIDNLSWEAHNLYAVSLDQIGNNYEAQKHYSIALKLSKNNPQILNNLGLSYAITGDLEKAEQSLRASLGGNQGTAKMRQNLALVVALRGDLDEAERLAKTDLPPAASSVAIAYLRKLANKQDYWGELTPSGKSQNINPNYQNQAGQNNQNIQNNANQAQNNGQTNNLIPAPYADVTSTNLAPLNEFGSTQPTNLSPSRTNSNGNIYVPVSTGDDKMVVQAYGNPVTGPVNQGYVNLGQGQSQTQNEEKEQKDKPWWKIF